MTLETNYYEVDGLPTNFIETIKTQFRKKDIQTSVALMDKRLPQDETTQMLNVIWEVVASNKITLDEAANRIGVTKDTLDMAWQRGGFSSLYENRLSM